MIYRHRLKVSIGFSCATLVLHVIIVTAVVIDMMYNSGHVIIVTAIVIDTVYISGLNEELVHLLMERDELHMEQDSMLVDIEDLTRYVLPGVH